MKGIIFSLILGLALPLGVCAQYVVLRGYVLHDISNNPIKGVDVSILGVDNVKTDSQGSFSLNIPATYSAGDDIEIAIFDKAYGFHKHTYRLNNKKQQSTTIKIQRNTNIGVYGTVKDNNSKSFIKGLKISISSPNLNTNIPVIRTNEFGVFIFSIPKSDFNQFSEYLDVLIQDSTGTYKDFQKTMNIMAPMEIELEKKSKTIVVPSKVGSYKIIEIDAKVGNWIKINASGSMKVGNWIGNSTPDGRSGGIMGMSITQYNIVPNFNHAALLYKLPGDTEWKSCGANCQFQSPTSGKLKITFEINDNTQGDNSGAYDILITTDL